MLWYVFTDLSAALAAEIFISRLMSNDNMELQTWIINNVRLFFMVAASVQFLYAICTYK